ncbi:mobilization relaxase (plasmid) [Aeromonas hydrophila]|nr:mobilization relaxase [Aeromonas hydrophila]
MIVKFHARGVGRGSGPIDYLLGPQRDREGATLDRGDPGLIEALIDSSPYAKKYTSGVLSFQEADLPREDKDKLMDSFERALLPGLDRDQYACLWVEHRDKERLELNFVIPNIELLSGKRLQPYFDRADRPRIDAWKVVVNAQLGLHDPDDPLNKRALMTPSNLPKAKQDAAQAITDGLLSLAAAGELADRGDVVATLKQHGFEVVRESRKSISIADPEGGRNIRLKGALYEQDFRAGQDLRRELEAAGERYRNEREERVRAARESYSRGVGIKRAEIEHRYRRPEPEVGLAGVEGVGLSVDRGGVFVGDQLGRGVVPGEGHRRELGRDLTPERDTGAVGGEGRNVAHRDVWGAALYSCVEGHSATSEGGVLAEAERSESDVYSGGVLNDRARTAVIESVRELGKRVQSAARGLGERLQRFAADVRGHLYREPGIAGERGELEQAGVALDRASRAIEPKIEALSIERVPQRGGMSLGREYREYGDREYGD